MVQWSDDKDDSEDLSGQQSWTRARLSEHYRRQVILHSATVSLLTV